MLWFLNYLFIVTSDPAEVGRAVESSASQPAVDASDKAAVGSSPVPAAGGVERCDDEGVLHPATDVAEETGLYN